ncbi:hypothetical protein CEE44_02015 [Candidatus Woesearchaeota archaeon B3_Woes]|nr:MAG: hypothetical protein CEE44_02015 [Candidatus Woesearchaeota archaeon B3_Woes]
MKKIEKGFYLSVGLASLAKKELNKHMGKLVREGWLQTKDARRIAGKVVAETQKEGRKIERFLIAELKKEAKKAKPYVNKSTKKKSKRKPARKTKPKKRAKKKR